MKGENERWQMKEEKEKHLQLYKRGREERKGKGKEVILIGFLPQRGGLDLITWSINAAAHAGDVVIALIVYDPSSTLLRVGGSEEEQEYGVERFVVGNRRRTVRAQLGELKHLCRQKQIKMDIKFVSGEHPEKVLVEQAKALNASTLVIGTTDRFVSWRKRTRSNYCVQNAPAWCSVVTVKNGKVVHLKENQMTIPSEADTEHVSSSSEGAQVSDIEQDFKDQPHESLEEEFSFSPNVAEADANSADVNAKGGEGKQWQSGCELMEEISSTSDGEKEAAVKGDTSADEDHSFQDLPIPTPFSPIVYEIDFDVNEDEEAGGGEEERERERERDKYGCEQAQEISPRQVLNEEQEKGEEDQFQGDSERRTSSSSSNVYEVYFDANQDGDVDDDEDEGGSQSWSEQRGRSSPRGVLEGSAAACLDSDSSSSPSSNSFSDEKAVVISPSPSHSRSQSQSQSRSRWGSGNGSGSGNEKGQKASQWRNFLRLWKQGSIRRLSALPQRSGSRFARSNNNNSGNFHFRMGSFSQSKDNSSFCDQFLNLEKNLTDSTSKPSWKCFTLKELESATNNFSPDNLIGKGGYAEVYKGHLNDGRIVAVKRLNRGKTEEQKVGDFLTELGIIVHIDHPNAARLIGFGVEGGLHIILQFSPHGSLASMLHGQHPQQLDWDIRYRVAVGTAKGLLYLHEGCQRRIIHRDIKASNILLTEDFEPQISDFGLAKWLPDQWTHLTVTPIEGTFGYLAPEYFMHGIVDEKTDVFAFGVLLLELITGRRPIDSSQKNIVMWAKPLIDSKNIRGLVDPALGDSYNIHEINYMVLTASLCIQQSAVLRPCMADVLQLLTGERDILETTDCHRMPVMESLYLEGSSDTEEYTSTRYISDLNRYREIALES